MRAVRLTVWILYARPFCALSVGVLQSHCDSDVNKTTTFKTKAKTNTEGHKTKTKTKTIGPITTYSLQTVNEIIFTAQYSITFAHYQLHNQIHMKVLNIKVL